MTDGQNCIRLFADKGQISACRELLENHEEAFDQLSHLLALAGNGVRLKIMFLLDTEGRLCPCDLADILGMSIPAVSQHLRKLKDGGLIQGKREGQTIYYSIKVKHEALVSPFFNQIINQRRETVL